MTQRLEIKNPVGLNTSVAAADLPPNAWTSGENIRFHNGKCLRVSGFTQWPGIPSSGLGAQPQFFIPLTESGTKYIFYATGVGLYRTDGVNPVVDYTRASGGAYSAEPFRQTWTGTNLNTALVFNNTIDPPQSRIFGQTKFQNLPNWPVGLTCKVIRSYKNFLIALNTTTSSGNFPTTVKWSSAADPGQVPASWSTTDPTNDAGENYLADTNGAIIDGHQLRDSFVIYKDDSVYSMTYVGGTYVFSFRKLFDDGGIISKHCVSEFDGQHFVVGASDVYIHNGVQKQSVIDGTMREELFADIDPLAIDRTYVVQNYDNKEMWVCYRSRAQGATNPIVDCNKALVWNWVDNVWSKREITLSGYGAPVPITGASSNVWDGTFMAWSAGNYNWNQDNYVSSKPQVLIMGPIHGAQVLDENSTQLIGSFFNSRLERTDLNFGDDEGIKVVTSVTPHIKGSGTITISLGVQKVQSGPVTWYDPQSFEIGSQYKINCRLVGRYVCIRYDIPAKTLWELNGYTFEFEPTSGRR